MKFGWNETAWDLEFISMLKTTRKINLKQDFKTYKISKVI